MKIASNQQQRASGTEHGKAGRRLAGRAAREKRYEGVTTLYDTFTAVVSASMIMAVGYDTGISGLTSCSHFLLLVQRFISS